MQKNECDVLLYDLRSETARWGSRSVDALFLLISFNSYKRTKLGLLQHALCCFLVLNIAQTAYTKIVNRLMWSFLLCVAI